MIKIKIQAKFDVKECKHTEFTVFLKITDGIEPILVTNDFNEVLAKVEAVQNAIPQTKAYDINIESKINNMIVKYR
jgi:hypothetical protein